MCEGMCERGSECVSVWVCERERESVCVCVCVSGSDVCGMLSEWDI